MEEGNETISTLVTSLVPSLSRSLGEQFNVFRVMHHGTHEKQLSNVFAWLLRADGTHELGETFQSIFMSRVNSQLRTGSAFQTSGYLVTQEVDTSGGAATGKDIADIVLTAPQESVVIENFGTSDGHGHDYEGYLRHGAQGGRRSVVVLLCIRKESALQTDGWEQAVVLSYAELLSELRDHIRADKKWRLEHPRQDFFITELFENFVEGPSAVSVEDQISFITTMCETGESARYGQQRHGAAAEEFAELVAQHAKQQFEDGRKTLSKAKNNLRQYAERRLSQQINAALGQEVVASANGNFAGAWQWCVRLLDSNSHLVLGLVFGPTAATYNEIVSEPVADPDFSKIFVLATGSGLEEGVESSLYQTTVGLGEVLEGFDQEDNRLAEEALAIVKATGLVHPTSD